MEGVCVALRRREVLRDVNLDVRPGVTALVGRNGAGKTTLMRALASVVRPDAGRVLGDGVDIWDSTATLSAHRRALGWLPQEPGYPAGMRVRELLSYAGWLKELPASSADRASSTALDRLGLGDLADRRLGELSGGQRGRAMVAAALVGEPTLLLLDEPTNGLDPVQRERLLGLVRSLGEDRTVVLATHLMEDVSAAADRWVALARGRVVAEGETDGLDEAAVSRRVRAHLTDVDAAVQPDG